MNNFHSDRTLGKILNTVLLSGLQRDTDTEIVTPIKTTICIRERKKRWLFTQWRKALSKAWRISRILKLCCCYANNLSCTANAILIRRNYIFVTVDDLAHPVTSYDNKETFTQDNNHQTNIAKTSEQIQTEKTYLPLSFRLTLQRTR